MHQSVPRCQSSRPRVLSLVVLLAAWMGSQSAWAEEEATRSYLPSEFNMVVGAKVWSNHWSSWTVNTVNYGSASRQLVSPLTSGSSASLIPQFSVRYHDFLGSMSFMKSTTYTLNEQWVGSSQGSRSEFDANAGYYLMPGVAATVGIKKLNQKYGGTFSWTGPTLGLSATSALGHGFSSYGSVGFGSLSAKLGQPDGSKATSKKADYVLSEAGLAYSMGGVWLMRSATVTMGYRMQVLTTKAYKLIDTNTPNSYTSQDVRDTTQGLTLGLVAAF